jgi:ribosomal protein S12 methylthiotransferase
MGHEADAIRARFPAVLAVTGPQQYEAVVSAVHDAAPPGRSAFVDLVPDAGLKLTPRHYAYVKISEGCNHTCAFCIIPSLRGRLASRPPAAILREAEALVKAGAKELLVISQDTSAYGVDLRHATSSLGGVERRAHIQDLARALGVTGAWVRLHYVYPYPHVDEVLPLMAEGLILPYLDVPFQHAHPEVLKRMKRPASGERNIERIRGWRAVVPELTLRSTFIAGFPGETEAQFQYLLDFLEEAQLDRVGCFAYSPVEGAAANALEGALPDEVREGRTARFMAMQEGISRQRLAVRVGSVQRVLVDAVDAEGATARSSADAPQIDGVVRVSPHPSLKPGTFAQVRITGSDAHDLQGEVVAP